MEQPEGQEDSQEKGGRSQEGKSESSVTELLQRTKPLYLENSNDFVENGFR